MSNNPLHVITRFFLIKYSEQDLILQEKAKILLRICGATLLVMLPAYFIFSVLCGWLLHLKLTLLFLAISVIIILYLLRAGYFIASAHTFLITFLMTVWLFFFVELNSGYYFERMASLVLVLTLINFTPLIMSRIKYVIVYYVIINILLLLVFFLIMWYMTAIPHITLAYFIMHSLVAFALSGVVSY